MDDPDPRNRPVTIEIPARLRLTVARVFLEEAIRIEAEMTPRKSKTRIGQFFLKAAGELRNLADKVRP